MDENHRDVIETEDGKKTDEEGPARVEREIPPRRVLAPKRLPTGEVYYSLDRVTGKRFRLFRRD